MMDKRKLTIMIVEDENLLLQAISKKLEFDDIATISCSSGKQAIDYLNSSSELPDAIWLDYQLKDMDGIEFMGQLKKNKKCEQIPVIVVSNSASEDKVNNMLAFGAKRYLLKAEYRLDDIIETIKTVIEESRKADKKMNTHKVLVVDDEPLVIKALTEKLSEAGFLVFAAYDGEEALLKVERIKPDLILLDVIMPKLDGISVLKRLKASPKTMDIPVIILTNLYDDKKMIEVLRTGNTDYLVKVDFTLNDIVELVNKKLKTKSFV